MVTTPKIGYSTFWSLSNVYPVNASKAARACQFSPQGSTRQAQRDN